MSGTVDAIDAIYDGVEMYKALRLLNDEAMPKGQRDTVKLCARRKREATVSGAVTGDAIDPDGSRGAT